MRIMGIIAAGIAPLRRGGFRPSRGVRSSDRTFGGALLDRIVAHRAADHPLVASRAVQTSHSRDAPLDCLAGAALGARFHSWRGASGRRYICSVFPVCAGAELGGLPEFDEAVALAVSRDGEGRRRRIAVLDLCWRDGRFAGDLRAAGDAVSAGASEWHIHLLAGDACARRAAIADLSS
jgi:hypothetical protein